jgi:putative transposase
MRTERAITHNVDMPNYIRFDLARRPVFVTIKTLPQRAILVDQRQLLREAIETVQSRRPFVISALVLLRDHLHAIFELPPDDEDFSTRISVMKVLFSKRISAVEESLSASRTVRRERGIWQRRFYEHIIRDERDLQNHIDYIHINPVKHGYVKRVQDWPHSSFHRYVREGKLPIDWAGGDVDIDAGE